MGRVSDVVTGRRSIDRVLEKTQGPAFFVEVNAGKSVKNDDCC